MAATAAEPVFGVDPPTRHYLRATIVDDLARKMVFVSRPRQGGKSSLAQSLLPSLKRELHYDVAAQREAILRRRSPAGDFWFFDEIHKFRRWRNFLKDLFQTTFNQPLRGATFADAYGRAWSTSDLCSHVERAPI